MTYKFKFRRRWLWKTYVVVGHQWSAQMDKMVLYFSDGAAREVPEWSKCQAVLGVDWVVAVKANMEKQAGQSIPVNPG